MNINNNIDILYIIIEMNNNIGFYLIIIKNK